MEWEGITEKRKGNNEKIEKGKGREGRDGGGGSNCLENELFVMKDKFLFIYNNYCLLIFNVWNRL